MIACDIAGVRFNFRTAGVCIEDSHVLLHRFVGMDWWFLPGGRVEARETSQEALHREMQEELGIRIHIGRLLWMVENFFEFAGTSFHELGMYYDIALPSGGRYVDKEALHRETTEAGHEALFQWFPLADLHRLRLVPPFLKEGLLDLPRETQHLIERQ